MSDERYDNLGDMLRRQAESIWNQAQASEQAASDEPLPEQVQQLADWLERLSRYPTFDKDTLARDLELHFEQVPVNNPIRHDYRAQLPDGAFAALLLTVMSGGAMRNWIGLEARPDDLPILFADVRKRFGAGRILHVTHIDHFHNDGSRSWSPGWTTYEYERLNGKQLTMSFKMGSDSLRSAMLEIIPPEAR